MALGQLSHFLEHSNPGGLTMGVHLNMKDLLF